MKKVLIVEDDKTLEKILSHEIFHTIKEDIDVLSAYSYKEALKYILDKNIQIDVAVLDLNLPDANEGDIVKFVTAKGIPSIVYSCIEDKEMISKMLEHNIIDYIIKEGPNSIQTVINSVSRVLKNYETNILLVDDSEVQLTIAKNILESMKLNVVTAKDGEEALNILLESEKRFSLVLSDYNMPKMDGMELVLKIRQRYDKDTLGIIILSANDKEDLSTKFITMGANDFINKPYKELEVKTRVNSNLELLDLFEKTRDMANKDFLTGAYNRRYFFESGEAIFDKAKRQERDLAVAMFDIDKFKSINDTYGHDMGDMAIKEVAKILDSNLRCSDLMARFGGEEFCVLLENISLKDAEVLFEKIRAAFEENVIKTQKKKISFTTSIGVCYGMKNTLDDMIKVADEGLYYCKNNGRNQVAVNKG